MKVLPSTCLAEVHVGKCRGLGLLYTRRYDAPSSHTPGAGTDPIKARYRGSIMSVLSVCVWQISLVFLVRCVSVASLSMRSCVSSISRVTGIGTLFSWDHMMSGRQGTTVTVTRRCPHSLGETVKLTQLVMFL